MNQVTFFLRSALRYFFAALGTLVVVLLLLVGFLGFTVPGARVVAWAIEKYAATPDQIVRIADPGALLTGDFTAGTITLFDGEGIYAEVRDLSVDWSPAELFSLRFDASRISAGTVRVERLPVPSTETQEVRSTFALPVDVKIDAFDLKEIVLGKQIAGEDHFLTAKGKLYATNSSIALELDAAERDRPDARATADLVFNPAGNQLKLEAELAEPKGGLLARLLRLPGEPAVNMTVTGQGPLSDWAGSGTVTLDGSEILRLDGQHVLAADGMHMLTVSGGGAFATLTPPAFRPLFEGESRIDLRAAFDGTSKVRIDAGKISTGAMTLDVSGTVDSRGENNLQARLAGTSGPFDFRWPLKDGELQALVDTANLSLIGDGQSAILDIAANVPSVNLPQGRLGGIRLSAQSDAFNLATRSGPLKTTVEIAESRFANADLDRAVQAPLKLDGTIAVTPEDIRFDPLEIESASIGGTVTGSFDRVETTIEAAFKAFAVREVLPPGLADKFDRTIALAGNAVVEQDGSVRLSELDIKSGALDASGSVALAGSTLTADIQGTLPDLGRLLADAKGSAAFHAVASGPLNKLGIEAEITSSGATLAGRTLDDLVVNADATVTPGSPEAKLTATGTLDGQAIDVRADVVTRDGRTSIPALEAKIGENRLTGAMELTADFKPNGTIDFNLPDLGLLAAMAGQQASGDLAGSATIRTADGVTSLALTARGESIRRDALTIAKPVVDVDVADLASLAIKGGVRAESVVQGENRLTDIDIAFEQQAERTGFSVGAEYEGSPLAATGDLASRDGRTEISLASASATAKRIPLQLARPTVIAIENGVVHIDGLTIQASTGTVAVTGTAGETLDISADISELPATLIHTVAPTLGAEGTIAGKVDIAGNGAAPVVRYDLTWSGASIASVRSAGITAEDLSAKGTVTVSDDSIRLDPLAIERAGFRGDVTASLDRAGNAAEANFQFVAEPAALPPGIGAKFDAPITVSGKVATGAAGAVELSALEVKSGTVNATGSAALAEGALTAKIEGALPDLGKLLAEAEGKAAFTADLSGPLDALGVKAEVTSSGAVLAGRTLSDFVITADATAKAGSPQAKLTATGALDGQAIDVKAEVVSKDGRTSIPTLEAKVGDNRLTGAIDLTADFKPEGTIDFNLPDLGLLAAMAGEKVSGDLSGSAAIKTVGGVTSLTLKANGSGIKRGDLTITKPVADISVADVAALAIRGSVKAENVAQGQNRVTGLNLTFDQQGGRTGFTVDGRYDGGPLSAKGDMVASGGRTEVRLASFAATPKRIPLKLARPTIVAIENGTVLLDALTIEASRGTITVAGSAGPKLDISVRLNALPAALINTFAPTLGAEGTIAGTVDVDGTAAAPVVVYDLRWSNASVAAARGAGVSSLAIAANGRFADNRVTVDATVSGPGDLSFRGGGNVELGGNMPISMKFAGDVPFALLANIMAQQGFTLTGSAKVDLSLSGPARAPQIAGTVSTAGARLVDVRRNLALNDLTANVALDGRQATISRLSANLASGGSIEASGTVGIVPGSGFPADLRIRLNDATYVDGTLFTANLAGDLTLNGPLVSTPVLGGRLTIRRAAITIPEKLPASLSQIDIKHRNAPARVQRMTKDLRRDTSAGTEASGAIAFDLAVSSPGQFFVRGRGIDAELGGDLTIRGTAVQPIVSGGFDMRRGRLEILGKRLTFTDGHIGFGGDLIPTLDLDATSSAGSTTITVNVAGPANNPTVTFSSSPALPQDEILAQLIFNRSLNNLSAFQIAQLASAVGQLAGGGSTSLLDGLRNKLGVDDLDITTDESGGAQVRAGKYLNDRTYLELQQGSDSASSKAVINLDIGRGVKLKGEAAGDGSAAGGIFFEREY
ncbi:translocation/assembly module TamB domain-containing protein [Sinorhizobium meliloti]|uniref:translocation/assembly module TamB domain-containing protein n=1 Tax=Rhizobium meliloti TaxID=382 RepID=UPI002D78B2AF|nr:translocation/assembly module TamB domain-containing protein [Sinorhizobium meliloti]WRQ67312.1 translocation/assembly module TamB domain-containing protein [Sinorhizobium meliloti]